MLIQFVALEQWPVTPTPSHRRKRSQFKAGWSQTIDKLENELEHLNARDVVIQADCDRDQIRLDGRFRSNAKLRGPGVVLAFESKHGPLSYPCDTYDHWQDNVRAIALALEALRAVDRYGVTRQAEQYRGWAKLPDKSHQTTFAGPVAAIQWLRKEIEENFAIPQSDEEKRFIRMQAMKAFHPDRNGGDETRWRLWLSAAAALSIEV